MDGQQVWISPTGFRVDHRPPGPAGQGYTLAQAKCPYCKVHFNELHGCACEESQDHDLLDREADRDDGLSTQPGANYMPWNCSGSRERRREEEEAEIRHQALDRYLALMNTKPLTPPAPPWFVPALKRGAAKVVSWIKPTALLLLWLCQVATVFWIEVRASTNVEAVTADLPDLPFDLGYNHVVAAFVAGLFAPMFWKLVHSKSCWDHDKK